MDDTELFKGYFKKDSEYYLKKLEQYRNGNRYMFNRYAFFFGIFWFMYRKMYLEAIFIIIAVTVEGYLEDLFTTSLNQTAEKVVTRITTLLIGLVTAMLADTLYLRKAERVIGKAKLVETDRENIMDYLGRKGGVSYWFLIAVLAAIIGICWYFYNLNNQSQ